MDHVAGHQLVRREVRRLPSRVTLASAESTLADRVERLLGLAFLDEADEGVDNHDPEDDGGINHLAQNPLHSGGRGSRT